jgi:EpsI family protein
MSTSAQAAGQLAAAPSRRDLLIGGALIGTAAIGLAGSLLNQPRILPGGGLKQLIPEQAGSWRSIGNAGVIVPEEGDLSRSTYDEVLSRVYVAEALPPMMLLIAYGGNQSGNMQLHRPEACYPAAGFVLGKPRDIVVTGPSGALMDARLVEAVSPGRSEQILYWTRIGQRFPRSGLEQRLAVVRENLRGEIPDGVLVRVSTIGLPLEAALPLLTDFIGGLVATAPAEARSLLTGRS